MEDPLTGDSGKSYKTSFLFPYPLSESESSRSCLYIKMNTVLLFHSNRLTSRRTSLILSLLELSDLVGRYRPEDKQIELRMTPKTKRRTIALMFEEELLELFMMN